MRRARIARKSAFPQAPRAGNSPRKPNPCANERPGFPAGIPKDAKRSQSQPKRLRPFRTSPEGPNYSEESLFLDLRTKRPPRQRSRGVMQCQRKPPLGVMAPPESPQDPCRSRAKDNRRLISNFFEKKKKRKFTSSSIVELLTQPQNFLRRGAPSSPKTITHGRAKAEARTS